ncbi:MAG: PAS domain S-box protein [Verrucomicrobiales bacterium]|nr:PAS domain S-box protein [Verrucomicrobiales bacterium]
MHPDTSIVAARRGTRQVWTLAMAGVATVVLVLVLVNWALRELRNSERELRRVQDQTDEVSRALRAALTDALAERLGYLDDRRPVKVAVEWGAQTAGLVASLQSIVSAGSESEVLRQVEGAFDETKEAIDRCRNWRMRQDAIQTSLEVRATALRRSIDELAGEATLIEGVLALEAVSQSGSPMFDSISERRDEASDARIELLALATMVERLRTEENADQLAHHRDNLIGPCLTRLEHLLPKIAKDRPVATLPLIEQLYGIRRELLGSESAPSRRWQAESDDGTNPCMISELRAMIHLGKELQLVREDSALAMRRLQQADWEVHGILDRRKQELAAGLERILRNDRNALVVIGLICVGALGSLGWSVRRTLLGQIGTMARINLDLAQACRESQVASRLLAQQKYALDQHAIVAVTNVEGRISYVNDKFCQLTGFSRDELIGSTHSRVKSGHHSPQYFHSMRQSIESGSVWRGLTCNRRKDGCLYWVDQTIVPIRNVDGEITEFISIQVDVTEHQRREAELVDAKKLAEAGSRAKSEFLAMMSHEIRTPMNAIMGFANLLEATSLNDQQREFTRLINESSGALLRIINDILDLSRVEAGKLDVERVEFDLPEVVEQVAEMVLNQVETQGLAVGVKWGAGASTRAFADPGRVRQVLVNLTGNAAKFTASGHIRIEVTPYWPDGIGELLEGSRPGDRPTAPAVRVAVVDTGIGIPEEAQTRLFQTFSQADNSTTRRFGGAGLGLAISRRLVELMGGRIGMSSRPGEGSVFWFSLPVTVAPDGQPQRPWRDRPRVLLVQAHPGFGMLMKGQLDEWGLRHDLVRSGAEALERLWGAVEDGDPYACLHLDAMLPGMPPDRLRDAIRQDPLLRDLKLVLTGTTASAERFRRLQQGGFDAFCMNPTLQPRSWRQALEQVLASGGRGDWAEAAESSGSGRVIGKP